jgi:PKD repeat protein
MIVLLFALPCNLWAQTTCTEQSWIARWTIPTIIDFKTSTNVVSLVSDGNRATNFISATGSPWIFEVDFGLVRKLTGLRIYIPTGTNSPRSYEILVRSDNTSPYVSVTKGIIPFYSTAVDYLIDFGGNVYNAKNLSIVFTDAWASNRTPTSTTLSISEINFFQCGVDPLIAKPIPSAIVPAPALSCAEGVSGNITGVINAYYPGQADATKGNTTIDVNASKAKGASHALAPGDRVLIIQMQNTLISEANSMAYGDGIDNDLIASGWLNVQNTGEYEFGIVESFSGNTIHLTQPLQKSYSIGGVFQVVYSPVYDNVTITGTILSSPWDGYCGGIITFDAKTLNLNNQTINVSGQGFRGGKMNSNLETPNIQYFFNTYSTDNNLLFGEKGEGIAGAPTGTYSASASRFYSLASNQNGGSYARGAPGNAGGGGNDHNSGGGGGANIGSGGQGGASWGSISSSDMTAYWNTVLYDGYYIKSGDKGFVPDGGMGGTGCGTPDPFRIWMGGAGGGGHQNNYAATGGANGGGIILTTARKVTGTGFFLADGESAANTLFNVIVSGRTVFGNDGAGGGGAGGTIVFGFSDHTGANITYSATGGTGGGVTASDAPHGPGGGGGGGAIIVSNPTGSINVNGGMNGTYLKTGGSWGANRGQDGFTIKSDKLEALYTYSCDHGDAPTSFIDAAHQLKPDAPFLGLVQGDSEPLALNQPPHDKDAKGDDLNGMADEDGVMPFDTTLSTGQSSYKVTVFVSNPINAPVILSGWIDYNGNGKFDDNERVSLSGVYNGLTDLVWNSFPSDITGGDSYARFRISTGNEALKPTGVAPDGEVEDYTIHINGIPSAVPDDTCTHQDRPVNILVVKNDHIQGDKRGKITLLSTPPNGTAVTNSNGTLDDKTDDFITYTPNTGFQGIDTLSYELWNGIGNKAKAKVTITVKEPITVDFNAIPDEGCTPLTVDFKNLSTDPNANYTWTFGDSTLSVTGFETSHTFTTKETTSVYTVKLVMNTGCGIIETTKQVTVHPLPHAVILEKSDDEKPETVVFSDISSNIANRTWSIDGLIVGTTPQITAKFDSVGIHIITLRVFNAYGCSDDTVYRHTTVFRGLYVPNAFIPESTDLMVNTFKPVGWGLKEYTLMIFDLWGNLIWSDSQLNKNGQPLIGWDGKDKYGKPLPTDAYIWRIKAVLEGNKPWKGMKMPNGIYRKEGTVTIIR